MKKKVKNITVSVRARLQNKAKETNRPFAEVLQYYAMERFLYRLSCSKYSENFILKGALLFSIWQITERRSTVDIDFSANYDNEIKSTEKVIEDLCKISVKNDGLKFDSKSISGKKIKEGADYEGVRIKFMAFLGNAKIHMQIDVGFGDKIYPNPKKVKFPVILNFPSPELKVYPI